MSSGQDNPPLGENGELKQSYSVVRRQLIILGLFPLSEAIAWTTIFPYIYAMVQSFSKEHDKNTAIYAGVMVSVFTFGEFLMAPQWARISDRIGRKPTLLVGSFGAIFSALVFGLSSNLPMAIAARVCAGILNPNLGVLQTFVGELVSKEHQAKGFSVVPFLRGFGTIIGPVIGGYLAEPVKKYPLLFHEGSVFNHYPYLLPNLVVVMFLITSCILGFCFLQESHPLYRNRPDIRSLLISGISNLRNGRPCGAQPPRYASLGAEYPTELENLAGEEGEEPKPVMEKVGTAFTGQVILQIMNAAISGFLKIATLAMVPIFLATPPEPPTPVEAEGLTARGISGVHGGFGMDSTAISNVLLTQAVAAMICQILIIPRIISKQGPLISYRVVIVALMVLYCLLPFSASLPLWLALPAILVILWTYALFNGLGTTCSAILITNSAPSPLHLATINGYAASLGCLARTLGPIVSGPLFRLGQEIGHIELPFWTLGGVAGLGVVLSVYLKDHP